ncbi:30S ribosomal protein S8e [archaeon]|nr:30S ribosomal protein S8e [archaeon]MBT3730467.1 30S ribosomal protein S8e [archaeon]MBT4670450.1 30S ribosomal protein S8e [archaeon]MBT5030083.1 30S ribosomal protein S8e [archaeon]MBT5288225.1 30S ribosomal protein S8e [archaeon]
MALTSQRSKRKLTGGRYKSYRKKRVFEIRNLPILTKLGVRKAKFIRGVGGFIKQKLLSEKTVNVFDPKTKKHSKEEIKNIIENAANRNFVRRNIITKGCVVETDNGNVRITSRPGQNATLCGVRV